MIGAGPAGLAAAQQLRRAGHTVTVYERDESGGGLVRFGVPHFKIEKWVVERRLDQLKAEGVRFEYGVDVGVDISAEELRAPHDAVVIATGSRVPRDLPVPGRELDGVHYAMEYLYDRARVLEGNPPSDPISAKGKHVLVVGGGDTGADCVGHSHREGAASVTQIELLGEPPERRPDDLTPWPRWPVKLRTSYALKEGGERDFAISTTQLTGNGRVRRCTGCRTAASRRSRPSRAPRRPIRRSSCCWRWASCTRAAAAGGAGRRARRARQRQGGRLRDLRRGRLRRR